MKWVLIFRAFRHKNYRLFFTGQCISVIGTWIQSIALSWLVYDITGSALYSGIASFCSQIPVILLVPLTGVTVDTFNRQKIILITQILSMCQAFGLALVAFSSHPQIWQVLCLAGVIGAVNAFDQPARQSFVIEMVEDRRDLPNAIALNSSMFNSARLIGPTIAGIFISAFGEGWCFLINGVSYIAVIISLTLIRIQHGPVLQKRHKGAFREGIKYAAGSLPIRSILLLLAFSSLLGMPFMVLMPAYIREVLHSGPGTLGFLMSFSGAGALTGALRLAMRRRPNGLERGIPVAGFIFGTAQILFAASRTFALSAAFLFCASFGMVTIMASCNTVLQTLVEEDKRGRVMALYSASFMGMAPFGSLLAGFTGRKLGVPWAITICGFSMILCSLIYFKNVDAISAEAAKMFSRRKSS